jgi:hypothetical protein
MTFAEKFCRQHRVHPSDYEAVVLWHSLRPFTRLLRPILNLNPNYFAADREFVRGVGRLTRLEDFHTESQDFIHHPDGRSFLHRTLKLRASRERLHNLLRDTLES